MTLVETILKSKATGYFLLLWGVTFLLRTIADFEYYVFNWGVETLVESITWIIYDIAALGAAVMLFVIAAKILKAKSTA
jgi:hypothetical protein